MTKSTISLKVLCPECGKSLMDYTRYLNAKPSIKLLISHQQKEGVINLCSTYGCYDKWSDIALIKNENSILSCPQCRNELNTQNICSQCQAYLVDLKLDKGGKVHVCSRIDCKQHFVSFEDIYDTLTSFYNEYYYGAHDKDL